MGIVPLSSKMFKLGGVVPSGKTTGHECRETLVDTKEVEYHRVPKITDVTSVGSLALADPNPEVSHPFP